MIAISDFSSLNFRKDWITRVNTDTEYFQRFTPSDTIRIQFSADYPTFRDITVTLINEEIETAITPDILRQSICNTIAEVTLNNLAIGRYTLKIASADEVAYSDFCIVESFPESILLSYVNYRNEYGTIFRDEFYFRVEGIFLPEEHSFSVSSEDFRDQRYTSHQLSAFPYEPMTLTVGLGFGVPNWVGRKVNHAFSCSETYIDGMRFTRSEGSAPEGEPLEGSLPLIIYKIVIEKVDEDACSSNDIKLYGRVTDIYTSDPVSDAIVELRHNDVIFATLTTDNKGDWFYSWDISESDYSTEIYLSIAAPGYEAYLKMRYLPQYNDAVMTGVILDSKIYPVTEYTGKWGDFVNILEEEDIKYTGQWSDFVNILEESAGDVTGVRFQSVNGAGMVGNIQQSPVTLSSFIFEWIFKEAKTVTDYEMLYQFGDIRFEYISGTIRIYIGNSYYDFNVGDTSSSKRYLLVAVTFGQSTYLSMEVNGEYIDDYYEISALSEIIAHPVYLGSLSDGPTTSAIVNMIRAYNSTDNYTSIANNPTPLETIRDTAAWQDCIAELIPSTIIVQNGEVSEWHSTIAINVNILRPLNSESKPLPDYSPVDI